MKHFGRRAKAHSGDARVPAMLITTGDVGHPILPDLFARRAATLVERPQAPVAPRTRRCAEAVGDDMSTSHVNPNHDVVPGRARQGEDIPPARNEQKYAESVGHRPPASTADAEGMSPP